MNDATLFITWNFFDVSPINSPREASIQTLQALLALNQINF